MKKMDEIMELLTDEINGFQRSIEKLEGLSNKLKEVKVKPDTSKVEYYLKEHLKDQERIQSLNQRNIKEINQKLRLAKLVPKWLLLLFLSAITILGMIIGYLSFQLVQNKNGMGTLEKDKVEINSQK